MGTLLVVLFLLALCGLIAYVGDLLGRRMGKKRLTVFGLRPKHTAILSTVITGVLIAGVSLAAAFGVSPGVRLALTQGERLVLKNARLRRTNRALAADYLALDRTLGAKQQEIGALQSQQERLAGRNRDLESRTRSLQVEYRRLTSAVRQVQSANRELQVRNGRLAATNGGLVIEQRRLQGHVRQLQGANTQLAGANARLSGTVRRDQAELRRLATLEARLRGKVSGFERRLERLGDEKARLARENRRLGTTNRRLAVQERSLTARLKRADRRVTEAQGQLLLLEDASASLRRTAQRLATEEFIYSEREEIARRIVPPNPPAGVLRTQLETLLYEVRVRAAQRKAAPDTRHRECAYLKPLQHTSLDGRPVLLTEERQIIRSLSEALAGQPESVVLRAVAVENSLPQTPVPVAVQVFKNRLVLRRGEEIASERVYGRESEGAVLEELVRFLQGEVRQRALNRLGMIPGPFGEVGEVQFDPLLEVTRKIREIGSWARVGAVVRQDTWSAGQLHLDFYVVQDE